MMQPNIKCRHPSSFSFKLSRDLFRERGPNSNLDSARYSIAVSCFDFLCVKHFFQERGKTTYFSSIPNPVKQNDFPKTETVWHEEKRHFIHFFCAHLETVS